jgi:hypothetical protein
LQAIKNIRRVTMGNRILIISLVLALIMVMVLPMGVGATGGSPDGTAIGTVGYDITSIYSISLSTPDLTLTSAPNTQTPVSTAPFTITITSNSETYKYGAITVKGEDGRLSAGGVILEPALTIAGESPLGWSSTSISGSETAQQLPPNRLYVSTGTASRTATVTQLAVIDRTIIPAGNYSESLTFTVYFYDTNS